MNIIRDLLSTDIEKSDLPRYPNKLFLACLVAIYAAVAMIVNEQVSSNFHSQSTPKVQLILFSLNSH